jgi:hypothetical protein
MKASISYILLALFAFFSGYFYVTLKHDRYIVGKLIIQYEALSRLDTDPKRARHAIEGELFETIQQYREVQSSFIRKRAFNADVEAANESLRTIDKIFRMLKTDGVIVPVEETKAKIKE